TWKSCFGGRKKTRATSSPSTWNIAASRTSMDFNDPLKWMNTAANVSFRGWTISPSPCSTRTTLPPTKPDIRNTTSRIRPERRKPFLGKPVKTDEWGNGFLENAQHHFRRIKASGDDTIRRLRDRKSVV